MTRLGVVALVLAVGALTGCGSASDDRPPATTDAARRTSTVRVVCDGSTTKAITPSARPQADGIHLRIDNRSGRALSYSVETAGGGRGAGAPAGISEHVLPLPPGELKVACFDPRKDDPSEVARVSVEIVDEERIWVPATLSTTCDSWSVLHLDYGAGTTGERGTPVDIVREYLRGRRVLEDGDAVEPAGYPERADNPALVRLARRNETLATVELASDGMGGWLVSKVQGLHRHRPRLSD